MDVVEETREQLATLKARYPDAPGRQLNELCLLGVEREQIVAVAYREDTLRDRIESLAVDEDVKGLVRHAMRWVWKEEQMHTLFVRGSLLRRGGVWLRLATFMRQLSGAIAGWSAAVLHHVSWRKAPFSRFCAHIFTALGFALGKVPLPILAEMRHMTFHDYCRFSRLAEQTAALCWERAALLAEAAKEEPAFVERFAQMAAEERRHEKIFALFLEALDEAGGLARGWSAAQIASRLLACGPYYLPPARRPDAEAMPLGRGGAVVVHEARPTETKALAMDATLRAAELLSLLEERAQANDRSLTDLRVAIKATFMRGYHTRDASSFVDPALMQSLVSFLRRAGCAEVTVLDAAAIYDGFYAGRDVATVAEYIGYTFDGARVIDVLDDVSAHRFDRGMAARNVAASWRDADLRIAFGKLTSHPVDQFYLSFTQLESIATGFCDLVFVEKQASRGQGICTLAAACPPHFALIDAYEACGDGLLGIIAAPKAKSPRRIYAGRDTLAVDIVAARHLGEAPTESSVLTDALHWFDDPRPRIEVIGCDDPIADWRSPTHNEWSTVLSLIALPVYMLLSGRGSLFVPEMDPEAFPSLRTPSWPLRATRAVIRKLLGTQLPRHVRSE